MEGGPVSPPLRGHVRLYSAISPGLHAGKYVLKMQQSVDRDGAGESLQTTTQQLDLVAPRYRMAGSELYSLFPPPNAQGPFSNRFAQAVLKRRTLPWEWLVPPQSDAGTGTAAAAEEAEAERRIPWLALIVLTEGEGTLHSGVDLSDAALADYRQGIGMENAEAAAAGTCDVLEVTGRVVRKAFPSQTDLPYLAHVREVNLLDSEDANRSDDDGFVSVVASNRVLRGGQHYGAYLVSIEGQLDVLPDSSNGDTQNQIGPVKVARPPSLRLADAVLWSSGTAASDAATRHRLGPELLGRITATGSRDASDRFAGWDLVDETDRDEAIAEIRRAVAEGSLFPTGPSAEAAAAAEAVAEGLDYVAGDRDLHRFPVLAHWTFDTLQHGDFETLMRSLDVGLLGTVGEDVENPPTVLPTGHNLLDRHTRGGERTAGWYRGPLVPHELTDRDDVPLHAAEQAIRVGSDGIEDLSYAAAFELGRLLALADPRFVSALIAWRRSGSTLVWAGFKAEALQFDLLPREELERFQQHLGLGVIKDLLGGGGPIDILGSAGGPLGPLINPVPLREQYRPDADVSVLQSAGLSRAAAEAAVGLAVDAPFGSAVPGATLPPDVGIAGGLDAVAGLVEGAYGDGLRSTLAAAFAREVDESGARPGGGG
jgi:hypothetical protein